MSIYEKLGGETVVADALESFYAKLTSDPILGVFFEDADLTSLKTHQRMFLTAALGGPDTYEGRDLRAVHALLQITDRDFDLFLDHLAETLAEIGTTPERIAEVLGALEPLRRDIVHATREGSDEWGSSDPTGGGD
jgi:hemoglobin